jgi:hypothetical protein
MAGFVQIIEFQTSRIDEIDALGERMRAQRELDDATSVRRGTFTADRDRPGYYFSIVEFDSYESAMENSNRADTSEFAAKMAELCDAPPRFYNLDVRRTWEPAGSA